MKAPPWMVVDGHTIDYSYEVEMSKGLVGIHDTEWRWNFLLECLEWKPLLPPDAWSDILIPLSVYGTVIAPGGTFRTYVKGAWNYYKVRTGKKIFSKDVKAMYAYELQNDCAVIVAKMDNGQYAAYAINQKGEPLFGAGLLEYVYIDNHAHHETIFAKKLGGSWYMSSTFESPDQYMKADHEYIAGTCIEEGYWNEYRELENDLRTLWIVGTEAFRCIGQNEAILLAENTLVVDKVGISNGSYVPEVNSDNRVKANFRTVIGIPENIGEHRIIRHDNLRADGSIIAVLDWNCRYNLLIHTKEHDCNGYDSVYRVLLSENDWSDDIQAEDGREFHNSRIIRLCIRDRFYVYSIADGMLEPEHEPEPCGIEELVTTT